MLGARNADLAGTGGIVFGNQVIRCDVLVSEQRRSPNDKARLVLSGEMNILNRFSPESRQGEVNWQRVTALTLHFTEKTVEAVYAKMAAEDEDDIESDE